MDCFIVEGGARLSGTIHINGSKNAALPILATALMTDEPCHYHGLPVIRDLQTQVKILNTLGVETRWEGRTLATRVVDTYNSTAPYELVKTMRAGVCVLGPLLGRRGEATVSLPGGCVIGERPIDLHLKGLAALGAEISFDQGNVRARVPRGGLRGTTIYLGGKFGSSVLATDNVMCAAVFARGTTVIECAACEPEVVDLANCLNAMGAEIEGAGSPRITVHGVRRLKGVEWTVIPDRIEAATFLIAGAITRSSITIGGARPDHLIAVLDTLRQMGVEIQQRGQRLTVVPPARPRAAEIATMPYPAFPTDVQAPIMSLMAIADGTSLVTERIFPDRFMAAAELKRLGARITVNNGQAVVQGVERLQGAPVMASDLRCGAALVLAALAAEGETRISRIYHIERGYERFEERLRRLGARIRRAPESASGGEA
ncbi:MAG: UDP-N-acetylglucosamine 1-carboxyvinyltransferase [Planctomycetota bacterium]|nr:UDP-N-acetylglucosamine 1-carboxyvinyltransferase [Planctomycetota bacterium]